MLYDHFHSLKMSITVLLLACSSFLFSQDRRITMYVMAGSMLNVPYGDRCSGIDEVAGARLNDIDFSVLGMCTRMSGSGGIGFRASVKAWRSLLTRP